MREFSEAYSYYDGNLALALAPAPTPKGIEGAVLFFRSGEKTASDRERFSGLADIVSTRYFQYRPAALHDPALSVQGDRFRLSVGEDGSAILPHLGSIVFFHLFFKGERYETCRHKGGDRKIQERQSGKKVIDAHKAGKSYNQSE